MPQRFVLNDLFFGEPKIAFQQESLAHIGHLLQGLECIDTCGIQLGFAITCEVLGRAERDVKQSRINVETTPPHKHLELVVQLLDHETLQTLAVLVKTVFLDQCCAYTPIVHGTI